VHLKNSSQLSAEEQSFKSRVCLRGGRSTQVYRQKEGEKGADNKTATGAGGVGPAESTKSPL